MNKQNTSSVGLAKMSGDGYYLTLPSNVKSGGDHENTISHFKTSLIRPLSFDPPGTYEAALVEIFFPFTWYNITRDIAHFGFTLLPNRPPIDMDLIKDVIQHTPHSYI